jgi:N-acetylneuraminate epimerase
VGRRNEVWYDEIWRLSLEDLRWHEAGHLPKPLGYGIGVCWKDRVVCLGGSDLGGHHAEVFDFRWDAMTGRLLTEQRKPLPMPIANSCGVVIDDTVYVAGGLETPDATETLAVFCSLRLDDPAGEWQKLPTWPGPPRMLATAAAYNGNFYLLGGTDLSADPDGKPVRTYLKDAYRFDPARRTWTALPNLPRPAVAAPTPAPVVKGQILVMSGDDGTQVQTAPTEHRGFPRDILCFDVASAQWSVGGKLDTPVVTVPAVEVREANSQVGWIVPSGEARPGVRSAQVWKYARP